MLPYYEVGAFVDAFSGNWSIVGNYGRPAPYIGFPGPGGAVTVAEIQITVPGQTFELISADLDSSITQIPYVFTVLLYSATVFTAAGTQPMTLGTFATVANPYRRLTPDNAPGS